MPYLVDTDILIDFFRKNEPAIDYLDSLGDWSLSVITGLELIAGAKDKREVAEIDNVLVIYNAMQQEGQWLDESSMLMPWFRRGVSRVQSST